MPIATPDVTASLIPAGVTAGLTEERMLVVGQMVAGTAVSGELQENILDDKSWDTLFGKTSRFTLINKNLKKLKLKSVGLILIMMCFSSASFAQAETPTISVETIGQLRVDEQHAEMFGRLMVQDLDGRIKPMNTLASEFLRKLSRKPYFRFTQNGEQVKFSANQAFLAMQAASNIWQYIPLIKGIILINTLYFLNIIL